MNSHEKIQELLATNLHFYQDGQYSEEKSLEQATRDFNLISEYMEDYNNVPGPRVGDFLQINSKGYSRFTHHWGDSIQTGSLFDSYSLGKGYISYSGSLDPAIPVSFLEPHPTEKSKEGRVWIFSNAWPGANRAVYLTVPFRVFRIKRDDETLNQISVIIKNDHLPVDHPLHVCDYDTPQFKNVLTEYYFYRNAGKYNHPFLKHVIVKK